MPKRKTIKIRPALFVIDAQNCFMGPGGSYAKSSFDISPYRRTIKPLISAIEQAKRRKLPVFFSKAIREASGEDNLDKVHQILPKWREKRILKTPLCVRDTEDCKIIDELPVNTNDYIVEKRRDSAFLGTDLALWLQTLKINTLVFAGIDTSICVESTLRDAFNRGYDVILLSDATASVKKHFYTTSLEEIRENFGLVMSAKRFFSRLKKSKNEFSFSL